MMNNVKGFLKVFIIIDSIVILLSLLIDADYWIINTQIAFLSSLVVSLFTFLSYSRNVNKSVQNIALSEDLDVINKIEDPYDLYSEDSINEEVILNPTKEEIQHAMKPVKKNYFLNLKNSILTYTSLGRVLGYVLLVMGFFYLRNNEYLNIYAYLVGFLVVPFSALIVAATKKG